MLDHVHVFVPRRADRRASSGGAGIQGSNARMLREEFSHLRRFATVLWSYFASSVGYVSESTVRR